MFAVRHQLDMTTDTSGDAIGLTDYVTGKIASIHYVKGGTGDDLVSATDIDIISTITGQSIWTEDNSVSVTRTVAPKMSSYGVDGIVALYAASGLGVLTDIVLAEERVQVTLSNGGDTKSGTFHVVVS